MDRSPDPTGRARGGAGTRGGGRPAGRSPGGHGRRPGGTLGGHGRRAAHAEGPLTVLPSVADRRRPSARRGRRQQVVGRDGGRGRRGAVGPVGGRAAAAGRHADASVDLEGGAVGGVPDRHLAPGPAAGGLRRLVRRMVRALRLEPGWVGPSTGIDGQLPRAPAVDRPEDAQADPPVPVPRVAVDPAVAPGAVLREVRREPAPRHLRERQPGDLLGRAARDPLGRVHVLPRRA